MDPLPGVRVMKKDFLDADAPDMIRAALGGHPADVVLSDMAAPTTGHRQTDHLRTVHLCEAAADFAVSVLRSRAGTSWPRCSRAAPRATCSSR